MACMQAKGQERIEVDRGREWERQQLEEQGTVSQISLDQLGDPMSTRPFIGGRGPGGCFPTGHDDADEIWKKLQHLSGDDDGGSSGQQPQTERAAHLAAEVEQLKAAIKQQMQDIHSQIQQLQSQAHHILRTQEEHGSSCNKNYHQLQTEHAHLTAELDGLKAAINARTQETQSQAQQLQCQVEQVLQVQAEQKRREEEHSKGDDEQQLRDEHTHLASEVEQLKLAILQQMGQIRSHSEELQSQAQQILQMQAEQRRRPLLNFYSLIFCMIVVFLAFKILSVCRPS